MSRKLTGIQTGPRQLELPPNIPVSDSAGTYADAELLAADVEDVRVVELVARQRADAVGAEELVLVQHPGQDAAQLRLVDDGEQPAAAAAGACSAVWTLAIRSGVRSRNRSDALREVRQLLQHVLLEDRDAHSGSRPTIERTFSRWPAPSGSRSTS